MGLLAFKFDLIVQTIVVSIGIYGKLIDQ